MRVGEARRCGGRGKQVSAWEELGNVRVGEARRFVDRGGKEMWVVREARRCGGRGGN